MKRKNIVVILELPEGDQYKEAALDRLEIMFDSRKNKEAIDKAFPDAWDQLLEYGKKYKLSLTFEEQP